MGSFATVSPTKPPDYLAYETTKMLTDLLTHGKTTVRESMFDLAGKGSAGGRADKRLP